MYDVAIVGGGVVGCAIARELSRYSISVVLLEKEIEVGFGTSKTNSGIVHPGHHDALNSLKGRLAVSGNAMIRALSTELNFGYRQIGELLVAENDEDIRTLEDLKAIGEARGVPGLEIWDRARLRMEEPNLSTHLLAALYAPTAGVINPYEFAFALIECATKNGVELRVESDVVGIERAADHLLVRTRTESIVARFVLNCAGVYADTIAQMVGLTDFRIKPRKGEEYLLDKRMKGIVKRLIFPTPRKTSKGTLIIPTFDGTIMVGPTAHEVDNPDDVATSYEGCAEVFAFVRRFCPAIKERTIIAEFAGVRAASDTGDFVIGATQVPGFINVAGIQSPGLTASPAIAVYVTEILASQGLSLVEKDYFEPRVAAPARFALRTHEERKALVSEDPLHGRVVCRCELVTEGEVVQAIAHGARTLDGIKFRTRAGMGRCQGGFCTSRCMEILSKRLGKPIETITKRGGGSWLVTPMSESEFTEET